MLEKKATKNSVKLYESTYKELDEERLQARVKGLPEPTFAELIEKCLRASKKGTPYDKAREWHYEAANREWHDKLETVLNSGDEDTISAVSQNIKVFFDRLRPSKAARRVGGR